MGEGGYEVTLDFDLDVQLHVKYATDGREVTRYAVVLVFLCNETIETIRVYDSAHGFNEMHRYTRNGGKQPGVPFHAGTLGEGMRAAISEVDHGYGEMIEGWRR